MNYCYDYWLAYFYKILFIQIEIVVNFQYYALQTINIWKCWVDYYTTLIGLAVGLHRLLLNVKFYTSYENENYVDDSLNQ